MDIEQRINGAYWAAAGHDLNKKGYALIPAVLTDAECDEFVFQYNNETLYRKTINMEQYRFGIGEYKYYCYPLPPVVQSLREHVYPRLVPVANGWTQMLNLDIQFPVQLTGLLELCKDKNQERSTSLILRYEKGGYNTLHQDLYGDVYFPMQAALFLSSPEEDYSGGEFVLIEQRPRAQSKAIVLKPNKGDMLIFTTSFRPLQGKNGYFRVNMKHGVSEVTDGNRYTLGIIFHDAL